MGVGGFGSVSLRNSALYFLMPPNAHSAGVAHLYYLLLKMRARAVLIITYLN